MSLAQICEMLENDGLYGNELCQSLAEILQECITNRHLSPVLLLNTHQHEASRIAQHLHFTAKTFFQLKGNFFQKDARSLLSEAKENQTIPSTIYLGSTFFISNLDMLASEELECLLRFLSSSQAIQQGKCLVISSLSICPSDQTDQQLQSFFQKIIPITPLHQRHQDIDTLVYQLTKQHLHTSFPNIKGFSLESVAHIHCAVHQTKRDHQDLENFFRVICGRLKSNRLPTHEGFLTAWPVIRILEDLWGYRLQLRRDKTQAIQQYDFQSLLLSASLEQGSQQSGFSKDLLTQKTNLLKQLIHELPEHQRSYQGLSSRLDQLTWISMKLISQARTQAELREFFGFGSRGKIPKATTKLKFDQHQLEQYGFQVSDPANFSNSKTNWKQQTVTPSEPILHSPSSRCIQEIEGEIRETLFWKHQDLFTVLAADTLHLTQISNLMNREATHVQSDLERLVKHGLLQQQDQFYLLPVDDIYYKHTHSQLLFLEKNLSHYLNSAFAMKEKAILDNVFLRLPSDGLSKIRKEVFDPFIQQQLFPLSDQRSIFTPKDNYSKEMYALLLIGTHRLSSQIHARTPLQQRVIHSFRQACLQKVDQTQRHQAICLQATIMLTKEQADQAFESIKDLRNGIRKYLPQGRGNKPNFNQTLCFTKVPVCFDREIPEKLL